MVASVEVELDWRGKRFRDIERGLRAIGRDIDRDFEEVGPLVKKLMNQYMAGVVGSVRERMQTPWPLGTSPAGAFPGTLSKRSGELQAQFVPANINVTGNRTSDIEVSFTLPGIAAVHERGAIIRPKKSKYLTIPLPAALDARGVPLRPNARAWKDAFIIRPKKGNLLIVRRSIGGGIVPLYVLKKSVRIPKRLAFEEAFEAGTDLLADTIAQEIVREFF